MVFVTSSASAFQPASRAAFRHAVPELRDTSASAFQPPIKIKVNPSLAMLTSFLCVSNSANFPSQADAALL